MYCGHGRKRGLFLLLFVASVTALFAQTPEDADYRRLDRELMEEYLPRIESDTSIFYRAVQATEDIFGEIADYDLSFVAFSRRGQRYYREMAVFDGIPVRSEYRSLLGNLQLDRRRYSGIRHSETFVGGDNGFTEYLSELSELPKTGAVNVNFADRGYWVGMRASFSETLNNGWSMSAYASGRTGRDLHVDGVFTNSAEAGLRVAKHWNYRNRLSVIAMFSPSERGMRRASVSEAFTLTGNNLYNPSWGFYNGKVRNANVRRTMIPSIMAAFDSEISPRTRLTLSAGADAGISRYSALEWFDALTPLPDNYRYLPSYYSRFAISDKVASVWRDRNAKYTQIDWDELYLRNTMAADGLAIYAVGDRVERVADVNLRAAAVTDAGRGVVIGYGARFRSNNRRNWRQMRDLLGADHIVDIDQYLEGDSRYGNMLQNNLRNPDRVVREGDRYGYDYSLTERYAGVFATFSRQSDRSHLDFAAEIGDKTIFRRGYYEKELFPGSESFGRSRRVSLAPYTVKAAYGYSFTPQHYLELCGSFSGDTPDAEDFFLQTQYNNRLVDNPRLRTTAGIELNYTFIHRTIDLKATAYATFIRHDCEVSHYYDDLSGQYVDMVMAETGRLNMGVEVSANIRISRYWSASAALSAGRYTYNCDPIITLYSDTGNRILLDRSPARMADCRTGNAPQLAGKAELSYMRRGFGARMSLNYAGLRYVEPMAVRRTDRTTHQAAATKEIFDMFVTQERLPDAFTADASVWKVFWLKNDYRGSRSRIVVSLSAKNLVGSRNIIYSGRESLRILRHRVGPRNYYFPFATTYLYSYPRTFRLSVTYKF